MKFEEMMITPALAEQMLERNSVNRKIHIQRANQYATDMKLGRWQLNGEAIKIYKDGTLADGQHRLKGVIIANIPVRMNVITELPKDITIQDRGRSRSVADQLATEGMSKIIANNKNVAVAKLHYYVQKGFSVVSDGLVVGFLKKHELLLEILADLCHCSGKKDGRVNIDSAPIKLAVFYAINSGEYPHDIAANFLSVLKTGIPENMSQTAAIVCRNDILSGVINTRGGSHERGTAVIKIEKALFDFNNGYQRKVTYQSWKTPIYSNHRNNKED